MIALNIVLVALAVAFGLVPLLLTARLKRRLREIAQMPALPPFAPPASVVLPCKGLDPGFRENIAALISQDYPDLELLFVVATDDDPAYAVLTSLLAADAGRKAARARVLVAGLGIERAQKLTNQLAAVRQARPTSEVLVFVDSDCRPDPGFVRRLVQPLQDKQIGATTGYRWYHPPAPTFGSVLRSTWNAGALPFLIDPKVVFAWGGAMAIRRQTFEQAGIARAWDRAVSDDMTLTVAVRDRGLDLQFVTSCIAVSYESSTLAETLEFTNRQSLISRIYFPPLWWGTAVGHSLANLLIFYGVACLALWLQHGTTGWLIGSLCTLLVLVQAGNAAWMFGAALELLPAPVRPQLRALRWHYIAMAPLASIMTLFNTVHAACTRRMVWRGICYELRSPTETVVISTDRAR